MASLHNEPSVAKEEQPAGELQLMPGSIAGWHPEALIFQSIFSGAQVDTAAGSPFSDGIHPFGTQSRSSRSSKSLHGRK